MSRGTYSNFKEDNADKLYQLMTITDDVTIKIVDPNLEWIKYNPKKLKEAISSLIKDL